MRMEKEGDLRDFDLSISEAADLLGFSAHPSLEFMENSLEKENIQWVAVLWEKMPCLVSEENGLTAGGAKITQALFTTTPENWGYSSQGLIKTGR